MSNEDSPPVLTSRLTAYKAVQIAKETAEKGNEAGIAWYLSLLNSPEICKRYADNGSEIAIVKYFRHNHSNEVITFFADKGSEEAIRYLLSTFKKYPDQRAKQLPLAKRHIKKGSLVASSKLLSILALHLD